MFALDANDPRICQNFGLHLVEEGPAINVLLTLGRDNAQEITACTCLTPVEARDLAMKLWNGAKSADQAMNEAATRKEGC